MSPEELLRKAMAARSPATRARYAKKGLSINAALDPTTQAMLLRQLYLSLFETMHFADAERTALTAAELGILSDVLLQDAARAAIALGEIDRAVSHLRVAARKSPASRRAFHQWTLGGTLFLAKRYDEAMMALARAVRWGTKDKPLYRAHLALAQICAGSPTGPLQELIDVLSQAPCGQGYGKFILGHLAYAAREWDAARKYLEAFVRRTEQARPAMGIALAGELSMSKATLAKMRTN